MPAYIVLECLYCGDTRLVPAGEASREVYVRAVSRHLLSAHPELAGADAETVLEDALADPEPVELEERPERLGWEPRPDPDPGV